METSYFDQLQTPIIVVDADTKVIYYNHICPTFFKLPPRKLNKIEAISDLLQTDYDLKQIIETALANDSAQFTPEIEVKTPENPYVYTVIVKAIPAQGKVILNLWDLSIEKQLFEKYKKQISELRETHNQIVMSDKLTALGELTAGIGHEVSNPLTIIGARLVDLQTSIADENIEDISSLTQEIQDGFNRIRKIISNLNSFLEKSEDELQVCSLSKVVNDSIRFIRDLDVSKNIEIEFINESNSLFMGNELKIQQVVINLLKNSFDALASDGVLDGKVTITLSENYETQNCILQIIDNGPGVNEEDRFKIFDMFYTTKELGEGTGLGLAISQKIVELHHGNLAYIPSDIGACFEIELPFLEIESFSATSRYLNGESTYEDKKILVLGENESILNQIYAAFKNKNIVLILSQHYQYLDEIVDFYMVDATFDTQDKVAKNFSGTYHAINKYCEKNDLNITELSKLLKKYEASL